MAHTPEATMNRRELLRFLPPMLFAPAGLCLPARPNFSGTWKQNNEHCVPKRTGDVLRRIEHHGSDLSVETTALRGAKPPRHALQTYTTDGRSCVSIGVDGDEFHTTVRWNGQQLVFSIEEHEDSRVILSEETWTLIDDGSALQVIRRALADSKDAARQQTVVYLLQAPDPQ